MAILCEAISVVVPISAIEEYYPGGLDGYRQAIPNATFCTDGVLTRVGMMNPSDIGYWVKHLESQGMTFVSSTSGAPNAKDFVVIDQRMGPTCSCSWIGTDVIDGVRRAWLVGTEPGPLATPPGWKAANSTGMQLHPAEDIPTMPWGPAGDMVTTIDPSTGATRWTAKPARHPVQYIDLIRSAQAFLDDDDPDGAYGAMKKAEAIRPLEPRDQRLAARSASEICRTNDDLAADPHWGLEANPNDPTWNEAALRWVEVTDLNPSQADAQDWRHRAEAERCSGNLTAARRSLLAGLRLDPKHGWLLLEGARIDLADGAPPSVLQKWIDQVDEALVAGNDEDDEDPNDMELYDQAWDFTLENLRPKRLIRPVKKTSPAPPPKLPE
jgi:hypothetical protein